MNLRRRAAFITASAAAGAAALPSAATAQQELPVCPPEQEQVTTYPPDFVRRGEGYTITAEKSLGQGVSALVISYTIAGKTTTEVIPFDNESLRIVRSAPTGGTLGLRFDWVENPGKPDACRGSDAYRAIPVIAVKAKAGRPDVKRMSGSYDVRWSDKDRARWAASPRCDVFGCGTRVRSNKGLRGTFFPQKDRTYRYTQTFTRGVCVVTYVGGRTVEWRTFAYRRISLRVTASRNGVATALRGRETTEYDTPSDEAGVCNDPRTERRTLRLTRR